MLPTEQGLLAAITRAPIAWIDEAELIRMGYADAIASALEGGLVARWAIPAGRVEDDRNAWVMPGHAYITLTPLGESRAGVALDEVGADEHPVWREPAKISICVRLPRHPREVALRFPELVPDGGPGPEYLIDACTGDPVVILGHRVEIDPRLGGRRGRVGRRGVHPRRVG